MARSPHGSSFAGCIEVPHDEPEASRSEINDGRDLDDHERWFVGKLTMPSKLRCALDGKEHGVEIGDRIIGRWPPALGPLAHLLPPVAGSANVVVFGSHLVAESSHDEGDKDLDHDGVLKKAQQPTNRAHADTDATFAAPWT